MRRICQAGIPLLLAVFVMVLSANPAHASEFTFSLGSLLTDNSPYDGAVAMRTLFWWPADSARTRAGSGSRAALPTPPRP